MKKILKIFFCIVLILYIPGLLFNIYEMVRCGGIYEYVMLEHPFSVFIFIFVHPFYSTLVVLHFLLTSQPFL